MINVLLTGADGQLGRELQRCAPPQVQLEALGRGALDICSSDLAQRVATCAPDIIINTAAYTAVDRAESEPELARRTNTEAPIRLAAAARDIGARLLHVSTDFVFDGMAAAPYTPGDHPAPLGVYGQSKLDGETGVLEHAEGHSLIVRTAWLYSCFGNNFVKTMLRLMATRERVAIVCDQRGSPTWARPLAAALWEMALRPELNGIAHWTDEGVVSWYDFALAIYQQACAIGLLDPRRDLLIEAIGSADYPTAARRPAYSALRSSHLELQLQSRHWHWLDALGAMLADPLLKETA